MEVMGRQGRRRKRLLDDLKETRGYWKFKEEALDRALWRTRFGRGSVPVVRQTTEWMNSKLNPLKTKRICFIEGLSAYRAVNTLHFGYKNQSLNVL
jgi:hypothetical protein